MEIMIFAAIFAIVGVAALISALMVDTTRSWSAEAKRLSATNASVSQLHLQLRSAISDAEGLSAELQELRKQLEEERLEKRALRTDLKTTSLSLMKEWRVSAELTDALAFERANNAALKEDLEIVDRALARDRRQLEEAEFNLGTASIRSAMLRMEIEELQMELLNLHMTTNRTHNF